MTTQSGSSPGTPFAAVPDLMDVFTLFGDALVEASQILATEVADLSSIALNLVATIREREADFAAILYCLRVAGALGGDPNARIQHVSFWDIDTGPISAGTAISAWAKLTIEIAAHAMNQKSVLVGLDFSLSEYRRLDSREQQCVLASVLVTAANRLLDHHDNGGPLPGEMATSLFLRALYAQDAFVPLAVVGQVMHRRLAANDQAMGFLGDRVAEIAQLLAARLSPQVICVDAIRWGQGRQTLECAIAALTALSPATASGEAIPRTYHDELGRLMAVVSDEQGHLMALVNLEDPHPGELHIACLRVLELLRSRDDSEASAEAMAAIESDPTGLPTAIVMAAHMLSQTVQHHVRVLQPREQ